MQFDTWSFSSQTGEFHLLSMTHRWLFVNTESSGQKREKKFNTYFGKGHRKNESISKVHRLENAESILFDLTRISIKSI